MTKIRLYNSQAITFQQQCPICHTIFNKLIWVRIKIFCQNYFKNLNHHLQNTTTKCIITNCNPKLEKLVAIGKMNKAKHQTSYKKTIYFLRGRNYLETICSWIPQIYNKSMVTGKTSNKYRFRRLSLFFCEIDASLKISHTDQFLSATVTPKEP